AIAFANKYRKDFSFIYSMDSSTKERYDQSYRELARRLGVIFDSKEPVEMTIRRVHFYLENNLFPKPWLLIFDNVEEEILLPDRGRGSILLTTRDKSYWERYICLAVEPFSQREGLELLAKVTKKKPGKKAKALIQQLDYFPLALGIAAHYLSENPGVSERAYSGLLQKKKDLLLHQSSQTFRYPHSITASWKVTLDRLSQTQPVAVECLKFCALLYPELIPKDWIEEWFQNYKQSLSSSLGKLRSDDIVQVLVSHALLKYNQKDNTFSIHRLKQEVINAWNPLSFVVKREALAFLAKKVEGLEDIDAIEWSGKSAKFLHDWAINADWFLTHDVQDVSSHSLAKVFNALGNYYLIIEEKYQKGMEQYEKSLNVKERIYGKCADREALMTLCNMGKGYYFLGESEKSISYFETVLEIGNKISQGQPSFEMARALAGKGITLYWYGSRQESVRHLLKAIFLYRQLCKEDNSLALAEALKWAGRVSSSLGGYKKALEYIEEALAINYRIQSGQPNLQLAFILYSRGSVWFRMGRWNEALQSIKESLKIVKKLSLNGKLNLKSVHILNRLGNVYCRLKQYKRAIASFDKALQIVRETFPDKSHHLIARALEGLGNVYYAQSHYEKSKELFEESLQVCKELFNDQPYHLTMKVLNNLGKVYCASKKREEGMQYFEEALKMGEKLYEKNHHKNIAEILGSIGKSYLNVDNRSALSYLTKAYRMYLETVGEEHPSAQEILAHLRGLERASKS
ncbi:MAG: tetratricopeptide repeat protein, partial [Simkania negevensis]|nr:tetratricopeptide repeat protein [Simkania negevensis]